MHRVAVVSGVDTIQRQGMEVDVQVQGRAEALNEGDGAALASGPVPPISRAPAELGELGAEEGAEHLAGEPRVVGASVAKRVGEREDPLADGHFGQDAVHQVCRGVDHAPAAARRAEATPLAGKGYEAIEVAFVAVKPQEAVGEDPAFEVRAELPLDEAGHRAIAFSGAREEGLEMLANDGV